MAATPAVTWTLRHRLAAVVPLQAWGKVNDTFWWTSSGRVINPIVAGVGDGGDLLCMTSCYCSERSAALSILGGMLKVTKPPEPKSQNVVTRRTTVLQ